MSTNQKGAIAESAVVHRARALGIDVYLPFLMVGRCDMIFGWPSCHVERIQCKWAELRSGVIVVHCYSCWRARDGLRRRNYTREEIDAIAAYCPQTGDCYYLPIDKVEDRYEVTLRVRPPKNNQAKGVNWAADYEFGAIAQLGERLRGTQEVAGSSPASSIAV